MCVWTCVVFLYTFANRYNFWCYYYPVSYTHLDVYKRQAVYCFELWSIVKYTKIYNTLYSTYCILQICIIVTFLCKIHGDQANRNIILIEYVLLCEYKHGCWVLWMYESNNNTTWICAYYILVVDRFNPFISLNT